MPTPILATKLYIPPPRPKLVLRTQLSERLNEGLLHNRKLTLIAAPAGFGKTTLLSTWIAGCNRKAAWLSLDQADSDPTRFLTYLVAALQKIAPNIGEGALNLLQSPQPPLTEAILTALLNEIAAIPDSFVLVLDDYHLIGATPIDNTLTFALEHLPPQMHLVITTREDPDLPLARLRARNQLTELRAADLRFTPTEAAEFLNQVMGLNLSAEDVTALERRTEGWIAGLQLAALSLQGHEDAPGFIQSFTSSHHFVLDYLMEEVLQQQSESVQTFLLHTSILERLCGPLCDAVVRAPSSGQTTLEYLERANLFIVPMDNERRWYRYHHLFVELLRQRLYQQAASFTGDAENRLTELHLRASQWYEDNGLELEAFQHVAAANEVERAERLIEGKGMPLYFRGAGVPVLHWLESLPTTILDARPALWVAYVTILTFVGKPSSVVEAKLQAAEKALQVTEPDEKTQNLLGHIAALRAMLAVAQHDAETILAQSRRALAYLHSDNLPVRTAASWTLGFGYQIQGDWAAASQAYTEAIAISQVSGNMMITLGATTCLGQVQEAENQLYRAAENYQRVLELVGDPPLPAACEAYLGLARLYYQWNELHKAEQYGQQCLQLAMQLENVDTPATCGVFLARLKLAQGDVSGATTMLTRAAEFVRQHNFPFRMNEVVAAQVLNLLRQGKLVEAAQLAQTHDLPLSQARVHLSQGDPSAALAVLKPLRQQAEAKGWADERLKVMVLEAIALRAQGKKDQAVQTLSEVLTLAEPGGFIRIFVDEGTPMSQLLTEGAAQGIRPDYTAKLLAVFEAEGPKSQEKTDLPPARSCSSQPLSEPLSQRELEVLRLLGTELNGPEIARELIVSLNTLRTHTKNIYNKLGVNDRRAAFRRAKELDLV